MPIGRLIGGMAEGYQQAQRQQQLQEQRALEMESQRRQLEKQQAMQEAAEQAQEAATTEPASYSGQEAMPGQTTVSTQHDYSGQGTDMSIANVYDQGQAMETGLRDQTTVQGGGRFQLPEQTEEGLKSPTDMDYGEYLQELSRRVADVDPKQALALEEQAGTLQEENFRDFARSVALGDLDRAAQEYNSSGRGRIDPDSLSVDYDSGQVSFTEEDGEQTTMDMEQVYALGGIETGDPFNLSPGEARYDAQGNKIAENANPDGSGDSPSASMYNATSRSLGRMIGGEFNGDVFTGTTPGKTKWFREAERLAHTYIDQGANPGQAASAAYVRSRKEVPQITEWEARAKAEKELEQQQSQQAWDEGMWSGMGYEVFGEEVPESAIEKRKEKIQEKSKPKYERNALQEGAGGQAMPEQNTGQPQRRSGVAGSKTEPEPNQGAGGAQERSLDGKIPDGHKQLLRNSPTQKMKNYFDEIYGEGAADRVLKE